MAGGPTKSSASSGVFFHGDGQPQAQLNSHLSPSFGNSANSISGTGCSNLCPTSGDMNRAVLNSTANSGPSVGASSLVTDANSALSGGPHLQRSASINTDSYMRLPASPMSFTSNNISISGSSVLDGSSIVQQNSHQDQTSQQGQKRQQGASTASSQPPSRAGHVLLPTGSHVPSSSNQEAHYMSQMQKKPRLDIKQEDIFQQQVMQQLLQRQDSMQLQGHNPQVHALIQQQRLLQRQQQPQQMLQSMPQMQRVQLQQQLQQQQQQQQLRQQAQQQSLQSVSGVKRPYESGVCARRLMQYIYHQRHRPPDNSISYWRKFTGEYFAPRAKKRWCLSLYDNVGQHALGAFPQATMDAWHCDICGSKSGRGFEATFEVLPRLNKVKFDSGVIDELLYLDMPRECRFPSGILMLEYGKAIQESVFEQLRVIREGHLRIIFTHDLKILSWEFCARHHEEFLSRRMVAPQVNQLLLVAQKYQNAVTESESSGVQTQDLQANCNMFLTAGRQLARNMELPLLNDLGFSKRYVRCLQISEVVNSMKDLIDFSRQHNIGPIESLKNYPRQAAAAKFQMQIKQEGQQGLPNDRNVLNKVMSLHPGLMNNNNNHNMVGSGISNTSAQTAAALGSYQNLLRQNSLNSLNPNAQHEASSLNIPSSFIQGSSNQQNHPQSSSQGQGNQNIQQHMIQQLLHEMMNNNGGGRVQQQQSSGGGQNPNGPGGGEESFNGTMKTGNSIVGSRVGSGNNGFGNVAGGGIINGMKTSPPNMNSSTVGGGNGSFSMKSSDVVTQNLQLPELDADISKEFPEWDM